MNGFWVYIYTVEVAPGIRASSKRCCLRQAIAALSKAMAADPNNAEVLLSLGVSYTNELDQGRALNFLTAWLSRQLAFTKACAPACICPSHKASYGVALLAAAIRRLARESLSQRA